MEVGADNLNSKNVMASGKRIININSGSNKPVAGTTFKLMNGWTFTVPPQPNTNNGKFEYIVTRGSAPLTTARAQSVEVSAVGDRLEFYDEGDNLFSLYAIPSCLISIMEYSEADIVPSKLYYFVHGTMSYWVYTQKDCYSVLVVPRGVDLGNPLPESMDMKNFMIGMGVSVSALLVAVVLRFCVTEEGKSKSKKQAGEAKKEKRTKKTVAKRNRRSEKGTNEKK